MKIKRFKQEKLATFVLATLVHPWPGVAIWPANENMFGDGQMDNNNNNNNNNNWREHLKKLKNEKFDVREKEEIEYYTCYYTKQTKHDLCTHQHFCLFDEKVIDLNKSSAVIIDKLDYLETVNEEGCEIKKKFPEDDYSEIMFNWNPHKIFEEIKTLKKELSVLRREEWMLKNDK